MSLLKMQISTEYGVDYMVLAVSVGLATIGVCVFSAVASVAALFILYLFYLILSFGGKENEKTFSTYSCRNYALVVGCL